MPNKRIADLITNGLRSGLVHPGDPATNTPAMPISLGPAFQTSGMPPQMAELANKTAELLGEAIVALIESEGKCEIVDSEELATLRIAERNAPARTIPVHCQCDTTRTDPLAIFTVTSSPRIVIDGKQLITGLTARSVECPHRKAR